MLSRHGIPGWYGHGMPGWCGHGMRGWYWYGHGMPGWCGHGMPCPYIIFLLNHAGARYGGLVWARHAGPVRARYAGLVLGWYGHGMRGWYWYGHGMLGWFGHGILGWYWYGHGMLGWYGHGMLGWHGHGMVGWYWYGHGMPCPYIMLLLDHTGTRPAGPVLHAPPQSCRGTACRARTTCSSSITQEHGLPGAYYTLFLNHTGARPAGLVLNISGKLPRQNTPRNANYFKYVTIFLLQEINDYVIGHVLINQLVFILSGQKLLRINRRILWNKRLEPRSANTLFYNH